MVPEGERQSAITRKPPAPERRLWAASSGSGLSGASAAGATNPDVDNNATYTLGTASKRWYDLRTMTGTFSGLLTASNKISAGQDIFPAANEGANLGDLTHRFYKLWTRDIQGGAADMDVLWVMGAGGGTPGSARSMSFVQDVGSSGTYPGTLLHGMKRNGTLLWEWGVPATAGGISSSNTDLVWASSTFATPQMALTSAGTLKLAAGLVATGVAASDSSKQLSLGDPSFSGSILLSGRGYTTDKGDVLLTGNTVGGSGCIKIRTFDGTTYLIRSTFTAEGGLMVGNPSGGAGEGNINVLGDVFNNNSVYNNPDYVFELAYGKARSEQPKDYRFRTLAETERFTREHFHLPGISREPSGAFARADMALEKIEELYLHAFAQERRLNALEEQNQALQAQIDTLKRIVGVAR